MSYVLDAGNENSKVIHITSTDATSRLSSDGAYLKYDLESPIVTPTDQDTLVSLYSAVIPYSFYNIRQGVNDKIYYRLTSNHTQVFLTIPQGSYTIQSLKTKIQDLFNLHSSSGTTNDLTVGFDRVTMKFTFTISSAEFYFDFNDTTDGAHTALGFPLNHTGLSTGFTSIESDYVPDVNGSTHSINIRTNLVSKGCIDSQTKSFSTILGTIPIDVNFGGVVFFRPADAIHKVIISTKTIKNIVIRLTDDRDRLLDPNGLSFNITLLIDHIKHKRNTERRIPERIFRPPVKIETRGRPRKDKVERTKKDIDIPLIN